MYRIKPWEELTIQDDYMFKLIMSRKRICKKMLEKLLQIPIRDIKYIDEEKSVKARYESKGVRLDVYVEDDQNTVYDIEMQVRQPEGDGLFKRTRYYQSMIDADLLAMGTDYDALNPCIIIFICPFDAFGQDRHIYTFNNYCEQDKNLPLGDGAAKIFLNTKGTADDVPSDVRAFLDYVDGRINDDAFVQEIDQEIREVKKIENERVSYMTLAMKMMEERKEGRKEGHKEGVASVAIGMLKLKLSLDVIQAATELPLETIKKLAIENNISYE
ncbi:MAG: Rpn family recombination-promoting nuclease/putative transposase [Selenomonas ruminantium]|nr:Rpn family recombination-promoting nuclease/putative transposase [Selenomonas ruminantium]